MNPTESSLTTPAHVAPTAARTRSALGFTDLFAGLNGLRIPGGLRSLEYYTGGLTVILILLQIATGILLHFHYVPTPDGAYESTIYILNDAPFGWLFVSLHAWNVHLVIGSMTIHLILSLVSANYRWPHSFRWYFGVGTFACVLAMAITGYLLPWTVSAFHSTSIRTALAGEVPWIGPELKSIVRGGAMVGAPTLTRFFGLHASLLPAVTFTMAMLWIGIWLRTRYRLSMGIIQPALGPPRTSRSFYPDFFLRSVLLGIAVFLVLLAIAALHPWEPGAKIDPTTPPPPGLKPDWYFVPLYALMQILDKNPQLALFGMSGSKLGVLLTGAAGMIALLLPRIVGKRGRGMRLALGQVLAYTMLAAFFILLILGYAE